MDYMNEREKVDAAQDAATQRLCALAATLFLGTVVAAVIFPITYASVGAFFLVVVKRIAFAAILGIGAFGIIDFFFENSAREDGVSRYWTEKYDSRFEHTKTAVFTLWASRYILWVRIASVASGVVFTFICYPSLSEGFFTLILELLLRALACGVFVILSMSLLAMLFSREHRLSQALPKLIGLSAVGHILWLIVERII